MVGARKGRCRMLTVRFLSVGSLKEAYLKRACEEYAKRLSGFCRVEQVEIKETRLPDHPTSGEIAAALRTEGKALLTAAGERSYKIALCVEGTQFSSEELSRKLETVVAGGASVISFFIGSSYGLSPEVKSNADLCLSFSKLTFPHQLMRVLLYETVYRCMNIQKGTSYHK